MTKQEVIDRVASRLGDESSEMKDLLEPIFDDVLSELASYECVRSLWRTAFFTLVEDQREYDTQAATGLPTGVYPLHIKRVIVPGDSSPLERVEESVLIQWRLANRESGFPRVWALYPNDQTLVVDPPPAFEYTLDDAEIHFLAPPTVLAVGDQITEIHGEHIPGIIAGMIKHGLVFEEETKGDYGRAVREFELMKLRMLGHNDKDRGRRIQMQLRHV